MQVPSGPPDPAQPTGPSGQSGPSGGSDPSPPPPGADAAPPGVERGRADGWRAVADEVVARQVWIDRAIVLAFAVLTGLAVVGLTLLSDAASRAHTALRGAGAWGPYLVLLWTPLVTAGLLWWTRRFAPGALGSGIPQVMRAIDNQLSPGQRAWLVSPKVALHKIGLVAGGMLAGLSIGREGPTVQVGAGLMVAARRWLSPQSRIDEHDLMVAGAAAGIAAAFNTPLGGIVFGLEELTRRRGIGHSTLVISVIVLAGLVAVAVFGNESYFGHLPVQSVSWSMWWPGLLVTLVSGLAGGLFARLMVVSVRGLPDRFCRWRAQHPYRFAAGCAFGVALIGWATGGQTAGAGYAPTRALLVGESDLPGVYTLLKFCATWLSAWTGVAAGVFAPSLAVGAGIGHDVAALTSLGREAAIPLIALGMVGFLAAATQAPITAFILVMEMVSGHAMVLSLMACAMVAAGVSRLIARPMYSELALLLPLPPAEPDGPAKIGADAPPPAAPAGPPAGPAEPPLR
jgi:chloride channel protein, CIC family